MKFDNSYSWTRSKEVFYAMKVLPPDTELGDPNEATPTPQTTHSNSSSEGQSSELAGGTSSTGITTQEQEMRTGLTTMTEVDTTS